MIPFEYDKCDDCIDHDCCVFQHDVLACEEDHRVAEAEARWESDTQR